MKTHTHFGHITEDESIIVCALWKCCKTPNPLYVSVVPKWESANPVWHGYTTGQIAGQCGFGETKVRGVLQALILKGLVKAVKRHNHTWYFAKLYNDDITLNYDNAYEKLNSLIALRDGREQPKNETSIRS